MRTKIHTTDLASSDAEVDESKGKSKGKTICLEKSMEEMCINNGL